ncbi:MAG: metalloregulator ArsR/SmtB family transcription factor [Caldimonas sp.]
MASPKPAAIRSASSPTRLPLVDLADAARDAASLLKQLANPDRLLLLCNMVEGERNVSALEVLTGIRQPTLSQQLGVLRAEGIVETRREGKFIYYRVASMPALAILQTLYHEFCMPESGATPRTRRARARKKADAH